MLWLESILAAFGLNKVAVLAGGIGAFIAAAKAEAQSKLTRVLNFSAGFACAAWGTPLVLRVFGLPNEPSYTGTLGLVIGYLGMAVLDAAAIAAGALKLIDWKEVIQKALGKVGL